MTREPVPAVSARRRARAGLAVALVACVGLSVLGGNLQHSDADDRTMGMILVGLASVLLFMLPYLAKSSRIRLDRPGRRYLTARTVSGWRTVDLHRLARIGHYEVMSIGRYQVMRVGSATDMLVLIDLDGVRLMVDDDEVDRATKRALANHTIDSLRISSHARHRLGLSEPPETFRHWRLPSSAEITFVILPLCFGPPALMAWAAYLVSAV